MYPHDLVVLSPSAVGLHMLFQACERFGASHDVRFNTKKSAVMAFRTRMLKGATIPKFQMCGETLQKVDKTKYLGHFVTSDSTDDADIERQVKKVYAQGNSILAKFHMCS